MFNLINWKYEEIFADGHWDDSIPWCCRLYSKFPEVKSVCRSIYEKKSAWCKKDYLLCLENLLCNFFVGFRSRKCIAIPRRRTYYSPKNLGRYKPNFRILLEIVDYLADNGFIGEKRGFLNRPTNDKRSSRYWALPKLYCSFSDWGDDHMQYKMSNSVIYMKDCTNHVESPSKKPAEILERAKKIRFINKLFNESVFDVRISSGSDGKIQASRLHPRIVSCFCRGDFSSGGRLYAKCRKGQSWQNIPRGDRKSILINDRCTCELDFSGLHINMLYALEGLPPIEDPYDFMGLEYRKLIKLLILILLNAKSSYAAKFGLEKKMDELYGDGDISEHDLQLVELHAEIDFWDIMNKVKEHFEPINKYIAKDYGVKLQRLDSDMALDIVYHFALMGIPVLVSAQ